MEKATTRVCRLFRLIGSFKRRLGVQDVLSGGSAGSFRLFVAFSKESTTRASGGGIIRVLGLAAADAGATQEEKREQQAGNNSPGECK